MATIIATLSNDTMDPPRWSPGTKHEIDIPDNKIKDKKFIDQAINDFRDARYGPYVGPNIQRKESTVQDEKLNTFRKVSPPIKGKENDNLLKQTHSWLPDNPKGSRQFKIPVVSDAAGSMANAINAPISGKSWQGRVADVGEGAATMLSAGFAPEIAANPIQALKSTILGILAGKGGQTAAEFAGGSPDTQRLAGDITGAAGALAPGISPRINAITGITGLKGAYEDFMTPFNWRGLSYPRGVVGGLGGGGLGGLKGALGSELGAAAGAGIPIIRGAVRGTQDFPWLNPISRMPSPTGSMQPQTNPNVMYPGFGPQLPEGTGAATPITPSGGAQWPYSVNNPIPQLSSVMPQLPAPTQFNMPPAQYPIITPDPNANIPSPVYEMPNTGLEEADKFARQVGYTHPAQEPTKVESSSKAEPEIQPKKVSAEEMIDKINKDKKTAPTSNIVKKKPPKKSTK